MRRVRDDEGTVMVLTLGLVAVLLAAILTVAAVTHLQLQRARLAHVADETALAAADTLDLDAYYRDGAGAVVVLDATRLEDEARDHFAVSSARHGLAGARLLRASSPDGLTVEVAVGLSAPPMFGAAWLPGRVDLLATASARSTVP